MVASVVDAVKAEPFGRCVRAGDARDRDWSIAAANCSGVQRPMPTQSKLPTMARTICFKKASAQTSKT